MVTRRKFIQQSALAGMAVNIPKSVSSLINEDKYFSYESPYVKLRLFRNEPMISFFSVDSLGGKSFQTNPVLLSEISHGPYTSYTTSSGITYFLKDGGPKIPSWECKMRPKDISIRTRWIGVDTPAFELPFSQKINHCTVLGNLLKENDMQFPCLLHFPGMGTFRIYCSDPDVHLFYDADRNVDVPFVKISLPSATKKHQDITYRFEVVTIYPEWSGIEKDVRFDGFRRNFINIFQINPRTRVLANNSASDACTFTLYLYATMAQKTPELAPGVSAMGLVRNTLDRYLVGMKGYGQVGYRNAAGGWHSEYDSSDSAPSLIISACYYIISTKDKIWASENYETIRQWAMDMIATDRNRDGLIEYGYSGNSGSWDGAVRPANWWDTIGFGHDDAYSNALAYHACILMADLSALLNKKEDAEYFKSFYSKLKGNYFSTFYNPATGVLAGWKSADGQLHDYYFTFVNSVAVCYGLVEKEDAVLIMQRILSKLKEVKYTDFRLGLPGNIVEVPAGDYTDRNKRFGYEAFQVYENGGATGCYVYFFIHALYTIGMKKEADEILLQTLESYKSNSFQGNCPDSNMTRDWKTWEGKCWGYEGFLVDNYLTLLAVYDFLNN